VGFELFTQKAMIDLFAAFDYAKADTGQPHKYRPSQTMVLNYTGVQVGFNMHFGIF
jgi:hypothetical protein